MVRNRVELASMTLGVAGGVVGLVIARSLSFHANDFTSLSCNCEVLQTLQDALLPAIFGSILGLIGGLVSFARSREGGIILLLGSSSTAIGWLFALSRIILAGSSMAIELAFGYILVDFLWWNLLIFGAGLIAFPTTRRILKGLRTEGWLP